MASILVMWWKRCWQCWLLQEGVVVWDHNMGASCCGSTAPKLAVHADSLIEVLSCAWDVTFWGELPNTPQKSLCTASCCTVVGACPVSGIAVLMGMYEHCVWALRMGCITLPCNHVVMTKALTKTNDRELMTGSMPRQVALDNKHCQQHTCVPTPDLCGSNYAIPAGQRL